MTRASVVGITAGSMIGRGWLVALTIFAAGLEDNDAGLAAAVLVIVLFTAYFTVSMIMRPFDTTAGAACLDGPSPPQRPPRVRPRARSARPRRWR